tara:strand:+ start:73130 stop:73330 length:201 start_codon:yes stop_codon:yes gene_type:complete
MDSLSAKMDKKALKKASAERMEYKKDLIKIVNSDMDRKLKMKLVNLVKNEIKQIDLGVKLIKAAIK